MRINLSVPFEEKDIVKGLGAKWDSARKVWYIENVENIKSFLPWIDDRLLQPTKSKPLAHPKFAIRKGRRKKFH